MKSIEECKKILEGGLRHIKLSMSEEKDANLRLKEIYINLKNYDFDVHGHYRMDRNEANKFIEWFEENIAQKSEVIARR